MSRSNATIREVIAELAVLEDRLRATAAVVVTADGASKVNPEFRTLCDRQRQVILALRRVSIRQRSRPMAEVSAVEADGADADGTVGTASRAEPPPRSSLRRLEGHAEVARRPDGD